ncbi:YitT family protein [Clostridium sp. CX1]|uniref:YitT family protein n=1 Tax=Clostridium sp. CX1 TaxID=2978346 RepID=UPI0021BE61FC|nr:YitT family protein [Clostridium sp. CX1]MCT8976426.1 YitT family protein [Clostridium sp. CX1]
MKNVKEYSLITLGVLLVALSIELFLAPNKIAAGGVTGIAIIINNFLPKFNIGLLTLIMDIILQTIGFIVIGSQFASKTIYSSLSLSAFLWIIDKLISPSLVVTTDLFLAAIFGTLMGGIGLGIVFNQNASTGGTDIIAKILNRFWHIDMGKSLLLVDFIVTLLAALAFGIEAGLYSLLCVIMNGVVVDRVIEGLNVSKQVMIISSQNELISKFIIKELDRGCTILHGQGGYSKKDTYILYAVLGRKELIRLKQYIKEIDTKAFISVSDSHEVLGEGFKDIISEA